jgi:glycosyltransferase involved in cell wall biosynthesis
MSAKILFVIEGLGHGGAERSLVEMLPSLMRAGISPAVAFFDRHADNLESELRTQGARIYFLREKGIVGRVLALRRLIRQERPDIVHTALFNADVAGRLASIGQDVVVVSSLVNMGYDPIRLQNSDIRPMKLRAVRAIDGWTARVLTSHFHAVSQPVKDASVEALGIRPERISVIERGRTERFGGPSTERRTRARQKLGLKDSDEVVITVGRQEYQKGQRYLLEAMKEVARRRPNARLLVAGSKGRQSALLESICDRDNLAGAIKLLGHRDDVPELLAAADLFVCPSLYEGAAGALIEAMAMGLPVVATRIPSLTAIVEENRNAIVVQRTAIRPLAAAIVELLADRRMATAFGRRSREIFEERFTIDRCAARMIDFYDRLASHRQKPLTTPSTPALHCE